MLNANLFYHDAEDNNFHVVLCDEKSNSKEELTTDALLKKVRTVKRGLQKIILDCGKVDRSKVSTKEVMNLVCDLFQKSGFEATTKGIAV